MTQRHRPDQSTPPPVAFAQRFGRPPGRRGDGEGEPAVDELTMIDVAKLRPCSSIGASAGNHWSPIFGQLE